MAISLYRPAGVIHSHDVPGFKYRADWVWNVPAGSSVANIASWLKAIASDKDKAIRSLVINCHGSPGFLHIGQGIGVSDVPLLGGLQGTGLLHIWVVACEVASPGTGLAPGGHEGRHFCSRLATTTGAKVMASDRTQWVNTPRVRPYHIDIYEGAVYTFDSDGAVYDIGHRKPNWMRLIPRQPH